MERSEAHIWHEMAHDESRMPWDDLLLWLQGGLLHIAKPKNNTDRDYQFCAKGVPVMFTGAAPFRHHKGDRNKENMLNEFRIDYFHLTSACARRESATLPWGFGFATRSVHTRSCTHA